MGFTDEELEGLSEEERAALEEDENTKGEGDDQSKENEGEGDDKEGDDKEGAGEEKNTGDTSAGEGDEKSDDADDDQKEDIQKETHVASAVIPPFKLNAGDGKNLEDIDSELKKLDEQFEEGDIPLKEYNAKRDALNQDKFKLQMYEDINKQVAAQAVEGRWKQAQQDFFDENQRYRENTVLNAAFVHVVNGLLATEEGKKMSDRAILLKAKATVEESLGIVSKGEDKKESDKEEAETAALAAAKKKEGEKGRDGMSLHNMPKSQEAEFGDKFDALDKLEGEEFELAIAKLSDAERKEYAHRG